MTDDGTECVLTRHRHEMLNLQDRAVSRLILLCVAFLGELAFSISIKLY